MKLRTGDTVVVISGKDKGKTGTILRVFHENNRVIVTGLNIRTRHIKKTTQGPGRIVKYEASLAVSKLMLIDPKTKKRSRVGYKVDQKGIKQRISKRSGEIVTKVKAAKMKKTEGTKGTEGTDVKKKKSTSETSAPSVPSAPSKQQPFWKKMGFGSMVDEAEVSEGTHMQEDHSIPAQELHVRKGARGS